MENLWHRSKQEYLIVPGVRLAIPRKRIENRAAYGLCHKESPWKPDLSMIVRNGKCNDLHADSLMVCILSIFARPGIVLYVNISSFHTHTSLCKHASGSPAGYAERASIDGCSALGFSDHAPYPDDSVWPDSRMTVAQIPEYISLVGEARDAALVRSPESPLPIFWGFECEWYPAYESWYRDYLRAELGAEYLVYGSHWVNDNGEFWYIPEAAEPRFLRRYIDLTVQGIRSGLYDFLAHPDLFLAGFTHMDDEVRAACRDIIDAAVGVNLPLEINGLGLQRKKILGDSGWRAPYPVREFWEMASDSGARIICNSDAHRTQDVVAGARNAFSFAADIGIVPEDTASVLGFVPAAKHS